MKKIFTFLAAASIVMTSQAWELSPESQGRVHVKPQVSQYVPTRADDGLLNFGYCAGIENGLYTYLGLGQASTLKAFIYVPEEQAQQWIGNKISKVMLGIGPTTNSQAEIIITNDPDSNSPIYSQKSTIINTRGWNTVSLRTPYEITGNAFYIGYSVTASSSNYPIGIDGITTSNNFGDFLGYQINGGKMTWMNIGQDYGSLSIRLLLSGDNLPENSASLTLQEMPPFVITNKEFSNEIYFQNTGVNNITSVEVSCSFDGQKVASASVNTNIPTGELGVIDLNNIYCPLEGPNVPYRVSVDKVNGVDNNGVELFSGVSGTMASSLVSYDKKVVIEEFTGTWCGWCPRGIVGMKYMNEKYGEDGFIGIAVHGGSATEPMLCASYNPVINTYVEGFPSALVDRTYSIDPNQQDLETYYLMQREYGSPASVSLNAFYSKDTKMVNVTGDALFAFDVPNSSYRLAFVLIENNVGPYNQTNYYAGGQNGYLEGWSNQGSSVRTIYDEVARYIKDAFGITNSLPSNIVKGHPYSYSTTLPTTGVSKIENCEVIAMILDYENNSVVNAQKIPMKMMGETTTIEPSVTPANNSIIYNFNPVTISWDGQDISLNPNSVINADEWGVPHINVAVKVNGETYAPYGEPLMLEAYPVVNGEYSATGNALIFPTYQMWLDETSEVTFTIKAGDVFIGPNNDVNDEVVISYTYLQLVNEQTTEPVKGSTLFSVSSVEVTWNDTEIVSVNPDCQQPVVYGYYDMDNYSFVKEGDLTNVVVENGKAVLSFETPYTRPGKLQIRVPEGYFILKTSVGDVPSPEMDPIQFTVTNCLTYPADGAYIMGPVESFAIVAQQSLEVNAGFDLGNIRFSEYKYDIDYNPLTDVKVASTKEVTIDGMPGLEFILETPYNGSQLYVQVPQGALIIDGKANENIIEFGMYVIALTVSPENGSALPIINGMKIACGDFEPSLNEACAEAATLTYNSGSQEGEVITLSRDQFSIKSVEGFFGSTYDIELTLETPITALGSYTFTIPADYFTISTYEGDLNTKEIVVTYEIAPFMEVEAEQLTSEITLGDFMSAIEIAWPEEVSIVDEESIEIPVYYINTWFGTRILEGYLNADYLQFVQTGDPGVASRSVSTGEKGTNLLILAGASGFFVEEGEYEIDLPGGFVKNEDGLANLPQTLKVTVLGPVEGTVYPYPYGMQFYKNENVEFSIVFDGIVSQQYSEDEPVLVTNYNDYDGFFNWADGAVYIKDENTVGINLGHNFAPGYYYFTFREGQVAVMIDDVLRPNAIVEAGFEVLESTGIDSIDQDAENQSVYNLQGIKVANSLEGLKKGIYIVNGKKVVVK